MGLRRRWGSERGLVTRLVTAQLLSGCGFMADLWRHFILAIFPPLISRPAAFLDVYADLKKEVVSEILPGYGLPKEVAEYQAEVMEYNVPGGKLNRGLSVVHA